MHHALKIQEILSNIFEYCAPSLPSGYYKVSVQCPELATLARTCRTFKDPALNIIWRALVDLSPLARCLPEASNQLGGPRGTMYSFTRPLAETEWSIIESYACRVRTILDIQVGLNKKSLRALTDRRPANRPLFPNLRSLQCVYAKKTMPLLHLPFPSLVFLNVEFEDLSLFQQSFKFFPNHSPDMKRLTLRVHRTEPVSLNVEPNYFCRWQNLQSLVCPQLALDRDALVHLSHMPALTRVHSMLSATLPVFDAPVSFSKLAHLMLHSESLQSISRLLSQIQFPVITTFIATIGSYPSRLELSSFLAGIQKSGAGNTLRTLQLAQSLPRPKRAPRSDTQLLDFEDLKPCMAFSKLRHLSLNIEWDVSLTDRDILALISALPRLEQLIINEDWGWNSPRGISPDGLIKILQTRRSLRGLALALDTRGYTEPPTSEVLASLGSTLPPLFFIDVVDSFIEAESVPAITALFLGLKACSKFSILAWRGRATVSPPNEEEYMDRWYLISDRVNGGEFDSASDSDVFE